MSITLPASSWSKIRVLFLIYQTFTVMYSSQILLAAAVLDVMTLTFVSYTIPQCVDEDNVIRPLLTLKNVHIFKLVATPNYPVPFFSPAPHDPTQT